MNHRFRLFRVDWENIMGRSLHNKIYLGRTSVLQSKPVQAFLYAGLFAGLGLVWLALRSVK